MLDVSEVYLEVEVDLVDLVVAGVFTWCRPNQSNVCLSQIHVAFRNCLFRSGDMECMRMQVAVLSGGALYTHLGTAQKGAQQKGVIHIQAGGPAKKTSQILENP